MLNISRTQLSAFIALAVSTTLAATAQANLVSNGGFDTGPTGWTIDGPNSQWTNDNGGLHSSFHDPGVNGFIWYTGNTPGALSIRQGFELTSASSLVIAADFQTRDDAGVPASHSNAQYTFRLLDQDAGLAVVTPDVSIGTFPPNSLDNGAAPDPAVRIFRQYFNLSAGNYQLQVILGSGQRCRRQHFGASGATDSRTVDRIVVGRGVVRSGHATQDAVEGGGRNANAY